MNAGDCTQCRVSRAVRPCVCTDGLLIGQSVQRLLKTIGVRALCLGQRFKPVGDFTKAFVARRLGHARVHIGVLVRFAGDRGLQIVARAADGQACCRIADGGEIVEVAMRMAGFTLGSGAEQRRDIILAILESKNAQRRSIVVSIARLDAEIIWLLANEVFAHD